MKTNFAYIHEASEDAVEAIRTAPKTSFIAGFRVAHKDEENQQWARARSSYRVDAARVAARLKSKGVQPLAVLPTSWWREMVKEAGLFDLQPDAQGQVRLDTTKETTRAARARYDMLFLCTLAAPITAIASYFMPTLFAPLYVPLYLGVVFATGLLVAILHDNDGPNAVARLMTWAQANLYVALNGGPTGVMRRMLDLENGSDRSVAIRLPEPPADVVAILERAQSESLYVAAEPGAVGFAKSPAVIIAESMHKIHREASAERARLRALDPIIYVEEGNAVAIIAQFGEFPMEQALIDRVVARQENIG